MVSCLSCYGCELGDASEFNVPVHAFSSSKRFSITAEEPFDRSFPSLALGGSDEFRSNSSSSRPPDSITAGQMAFRRKLQLPTLNAYPMPPGCGPSSDEGERMRMLAEIYQDFALDLHTGTYLTQLTSNREHCDIHCQLMEDMMTLKLDQSNGRIIEFPLTSVSKVYRIVKSSDKWYSDGTDASTCGAGADHIVVVEFMRRKLAFVFKDMEVSQCFLICMELLIRQAQLKRQNKTLRSLTPALSERRPDVEARRCCIVLGQKQQPVLCPTARLHAPCTLDAEGAPASPRCQASGVCAI